MREYFDRQHGAGFEFACQYPGVNRVLQAAGRVNRSASDCGVVLPIDQRYVQYRYRSLLPAMWQPITMGDKSFFQQQLETFWERVNRLGPA